MIARDAVAPRVSALHAGREGRAAGAGHPVALRLLRVALGAAGALSPSLAARAGERLFLTPPRRRPGRLEREALASGEPFVVAAGRERVRAWRFGAGPPVLLVHGWGSLGGRLAGFVPPLVAAGCSAVVFDVPGHGASTGRLASGTTFAEAIRAVSASAGARAAIAHSMGATALGWAMADGLDLRAAVLLAPARSAGGFLDLFCDALRLPPRVRGAMRTRIVRRYGLAPEDFDIVRRARAGGAPLLVVHDRDDAVVPWADGEAVARAWRGAELVRTEGLGHRGILRDPSVAARASAFVVARLLRCACGRPAALAVGPSSWCEACALDRELYERSSR